MVLAPTPQPARPMRARAGRREPVAINVPTGSGMVARGGWIVSFFTVATTFEQDGEELSASSLTRGGVREHPGRGMFPCTQSASQPPACLRARARDPWRRGVCPDPAQQEGCPGTCVNSREEQVGRLGVLPRALLRSAMWVPENSGLGRDPSGDRAVGLVRGASTVRGQPGRS